MRRRLIPQSILFLLTASAVVLLVGGFVALGLGRLLAAMGDETGGRVAGYVALASAALFVIDLICLILAQAVNSLADTDGPHEPE